MYNILWFKKLFLSEKNILSIAYLINSKNNVTIDNDGSGTMDKDLALVLRVGDR